jgi:hypothetical protein
MPGLKTAIGALVLVAVGCGLVFAGFELAAYEQTIADREVTTTGDVTETEVWQLPDGNWTYRFTYEYEFDQEAEITAQGLQEQYPDEMADEQSYSNSKRGGEYSSKSSARTSMENNFDGEGRVTVYVDPYYPSEGSLTDATSAMPEFMQYGGSVALGIGLFMLAGMARRVSS